MSFLFDVKVLSTFASTKLLLLNFDVTLTLKWCIWNMRSAHCLNMVIISPGFLWNVSRGSGVTERTQNYYIWLLSPKCELDLEHVEAKKLKRAQYMLLMLWTFLPGFFEILKGFRSYRVDTKLLHLTFDR